MKLTPERKAAIDAKTYEQLLYGVRFVPIGDPWFQDETGDYWLARMKELRAQPGGDDRHVEASKRLGG